MSKTPITGIISTHAVKTTVYGQKDDGHLNRLFDNQRPPAEPGPFQGLSLYPQALLVVADCKTSLHPCVKMFDRLFSNASRNFRDIPEVRV